MIAVVLMLLGPFGLMAGINGIRIALGAPPDLVAGQAGFAYTENAVTVIDPGILVSYDTPPMIETRQVIANWVPAAAPNLPTSARMFVQSGIGPITVVGSGTMSVQYSGVQIGTVPESGGQSGVCCGPLVITLNSPGVVDEDMIEALMRAIVYEDTSEDPVASTAPHRRVTLEVYDTFLATGPSVMYTITVAGGSQTPDPPVITRPPETLNINDDTDLSINTPAASTPISITDLDAGSGALSTTLSIPSGQGTLTMAGGGGCTVGGSGTISVTLNASQANGNPCLTGLIYRSPPAFTGAVTLTIDVTDNGFTVNQAGGVPQTAQSTVNINVTSVNAAPVLTVPGGQSVLQYQPLSIPAIGYTDADALAADVQVTLTVTKGVMVIGNQAGLTSITGDGSGTIVMVGSVAELDASLDSITYTSTATSGNLNDVLTVFANDLGNTGSGGPQTDTETIAITVNEFNDAPVITAPASAAVTEDVATAVSGISIADPDAAPAVDDVLMSMTASQGTMTLGNITGLSFNIGDGTADGTMQFTGTLNEINTALGTLTYLTASNSTASATLTLDLNDQGFTGSPGAQDAAQRIVTLNVSGVNDPPAITVPAGQPTNEDTPVTFSSGGGTLISVADPDSGGSPIEVSLSVAHGTLTLNGTTGLTFPSGANGTGSMTISGTVTNINTALNGMIYQPTLNYLGPDTLNVGANDLGNTGSGSPGTDTDSVVITISAVNDPPVVTGPVGINVAEDVVTVVAGVGVTDVDAGGATIDMTFTVTNGVIGFGDSTGLTMMSGNNGTTTVTYRGTLTAFNNTLGTLSYRTNTNSTTADTLVITADDLGNSGTGGAQTHVKNIAITVGAVNDGPTITVPAPSYNIAEEAPLTINGAGIQVADVDVGGLDIEVTLTVSNGTLTLDPGVGVSTAPPLTSVSGNGTATVTLRGSLAEVNDAISPLVYQGVTNYVGPDIINLSVTDLGNTGTGGVLSDTDSIAITVTAVNDAPVVTAPPAVNVTEDVSSPVTGISVSDVDAGSAVIRMDFSVGTGTLTFGSTTGLTLAAGANGSSSVAYTGTMSALNTALTSLTYLTASNANGSVTLTVVANDQGNTGTGGALTDTEMVTLNISAVNDAPNITVPGTQNGAEDVPFAIIGVSVSDVDANPGEVRVTLTAGFATLTVAPTGSLSFDVGDGTSDQTMTFRGTVANVNAALANLQYAGFPNFNGNDTIQVTVDDQGNTGSGGSKVDSDSVPVFLTGLNDPPVLTHPSPQAATEDVDTAITGVSVADPDVGTTQIKITLSVTSGTLTLNTRTGLTFDSGSDGISDVSMTFTGSMTNVNNALASIIYRGSPDFAATDTLTVVADDLGNVGAGGVQTDSGTITINVAGQNDAPAITLPPAQNAQEDTNHTINGVGITINDVDVGGGQIQVQLTVNNGVLSLGATAGLTIDAPADGVQDAAITFRGTLSQVNAALHNMVYRGNPNFTGFDPLTIVVGDLGNTGTGGPMMDSDVLQITVGDINDPPVVSVPGAQTVDEDTNLSILGISVADSDAASSPLRITVSAANGTISLGSTSGLTFTTGDGTSDATMTFTGNLSSVNAALAAIQYRGSQDFNGADTITIVANDQGATGAGGAQQDTETIAVTVGPVNDGPRVTLPGSVQTANSSAPVIVDSEATVSDIDSANLDGATLTMTIVNNATSSDRLDFRNQGNGANEAGVSGSTLRVGGTVIGTYNGEVSKDTPLVVTLNANATVANVQTLLRNLQFRVVDAEPAPSNRTVRVVLTDGDGGTSSAAEKQVRVAPLADLAIKFEGVPEIINNLDTFNITIVVTNSGPLTATGVVVTNTLPTELIASSIETNKGSCTNGRTVTCQLGSVTTSQTVRIVLRVYNSHVNTFVNTAEVTGTSDDPNPANNKASVSIWAAGENHPGDEKKDEEDRRRKLTEERRQQTERTNQHGLDDYRTEGNVIEVNFNADQPFAIVAMRDGPQRILLPCKDGCPDVRVGDYLEADGVKENEQLFYAENISLTRNGKKVK